MIILRLRGFSKLEKALMSVNYNVLKLMTNVFFFFSFLGKLDLIDCTTRYKVCNAQLGLKI